MTNRLANETSPYLLQHQHNPVDWYPWGEEALSRAQREDRPILLSIGYSACHWCHVMERESFEDPDTAARMNDTFVCIKVDREERPDLDELFMRAVQAFTGRGGWPMTVFLTPAGAPYFGGTYFPPRPAHGVPSFRQVLSHTHQLYRTQGDEVRRVTGELSGYLEDSGRLPAPALQSLTGSQPTDWLGKIVTAAAKASDPVRGGFRGAPKFPPHGTLSVLLAHHHRTGQADSLSLATQTLDAMAQGGMYDQLGGGFARYSVDEDWRIPHFEKMLTDNAQLLARYTDAWLITGSPLYERVVRQTVGFVLRELRDPAGGFWTALDADSEGQEGRYYAWTRDQLQTALSTEPTLASRWKRVCELLEITRSGTFEHGSSVLRLSTPIHQLRHDDRQLLDAALPVLFAARQHRVRPATDDKVVTAWNAMMISALARAAAAFDQPAWFEAAAQATAFLLEEVTLNGRLMRTWKATATGGRAHLPAYADDHAALLSALVDLYQGDFDLDWLRDALRLSDQLVDLFWDDKDGGLFFTGRDAPALLSRGKHMLGGALPSANGVAALAWARLSSLVDRPDLAERAQHIVRCYAPLLAQAPRALGPEALAGAWLEGHSAQLGVVGDRGAESTRALIATAHRRYRPFMVIGLVDPGEAERATAVMPWMAGRALRDSSATAWLCVDRACNLPTSSPDDLRAQLDDKPVHDKPVHDKPV